MGRGDGNGALVHQRRDLVWINRQRIIDVTKHRPTTCERDSHRGGNESDGRHNHFRARPNTHRHHRRMQRARARADPARVLDIKVFLGRHLINLAFRWLGTRAGITRQIRPTFRQVGVGHRLA